MASCPPTGWTETAPPAPGILTGLRGALSPNARASEHTLAWKGGLGEVRALRKWEKSRMDCLERLRTEIALKKRFKWGWVGY